MIKGCTYFYHCHYICWILFICFDTWHYYSSSCNFLKHLLLCLWKLPTHCRILAIRSMAMWGSDNHQYKCVHVCSTTNEEKGYIHTFHIIRIWWLSHAFVSFYIGDYHREAVIFSTNTYFFLIQTDVQTVLFLSNHLTPCIKYVARPPSWSLLQVVSLLWWAITITHTI